MTCEPSRGTTRQRDGFHVVPWDLLSSVRHLPASSPMGRGPVAFPRESSRGTTRKGHHCPVRFSAEPLPRRHPRSVLEPPPRTHMRDPNRRYPTRELDGRGHRHRSGECGGERSVPGVSGTESVDGCRRRWRDRALGSVGGAPQHRPGAVGDHRCAGSGVECVSQCLLMRHAEPRRVVGRTRDDVQSRKPSLRMGFDAASVEYRDGSRRSVHQRLQRRHRVVAVKKQHVPVGEGSDRFAPFGS